MKTTKILYWVSTSLVGALVIPSAFFINDPAAIAGFAHLQVPAEWFRYELEIAKTIAGFVLIIPVIGMGMFSRIWSRFKEWAYVGLGIDFVSAFIAFVAIDGFVAEAIFPVAALVVLAVSYSTYYKLKSV
jgi:hypothetical protein